MVGAYSLRGLFQGVTWLGSQVMESFLQALSGQFQIRRRFYIQTIETKGVFQQGFISLLPDIRKNVCDSRLQLCILGVFKRKQFRQRPVEAGLGRRESLYRNHER